MRKARALVPDPLVDILRSKRIALGLSTRALMPKLGQGSPASISEWETGHHEPTLTNLRRWANALGLDVALVVMHAPATQDGSQA